VKVAMNPEKKSGRVHGYANQWFGALQMKHVNENLTI
jgi:hypothetical protein